MGGIGPSLGAKFEVQLVPHDVREEEALYGALDALVHLSDVANTIFNGITDRFVSVVFCECCACSCGCACMQCL